MTTSKDLLIELITTGNPGAPVPFTRESIRFSDPVPAEGTGWNTKVTVYGIHGHGYRGEQEIHYTRVSLAELGPDLLLESFDAFVPETLLSTLNDQKGTPLHQDDFESLPIPLMGYAEEAPVQLVANERSLAWVGEVQATLNVSIPEDIIDTVHRALHETLPGPGPYF